MCVCMCLGRGSLGRERRGEEESRRGNRFHCMLNRNSWKKLRSVVRSQFARVAVTKHCRLSGLNYIKVLSQSSGVSQLGNKVSDRASSFQEL